MEYSNCCHTKGNQRKSIQRKVQHGIQWTTDYHCAQ